VNTKVGIEKCPSYDPEALYRSLKKAVENAGAPDLAGKSVLLKPNILSDESPGKAVTTHPVFMEASIRLVREMGASRIFAGDSPGVQKPGFSGKVSGLGEAVKRCGAEWVDFTGKKIELPCPAGKVIRKFTLTQAVAEADVIISLPKLKTHQLMYFTGALKNTFGLIPSIAKSPYHVRFSRRESFAAMIVDLNLAVKPAYAFMDAVIGMEGPGPFAGNPRQLGLVLASSNLLAMDVAASEIIAYPPQEIPVSREALSRGYWLRDFSEIIYPGLTPGEVRISDFKKVPIKRNSSQLIDFILPKPLRKFNESRAAGPEINHKACIRCADCIRICGSQAISMRTADSAAGGKERGVVIDYHQCIRCFCCHEICKAKAIDIVKKPRNRRV